MAGLLAGVIVLLGLNLIAKSSPAAPTAPTGACCFANGDCQFMLQGSCTKVGGVYQGDGVTCQQVNCIPAKPPTVVAGAAYADHTMTPSQHLFRFWSDGTVDSIGVDGNGCAWTVCGPTVVVPGFCTADVTRNGAVDVGDFLEVLGQWGSCQ